MIHTVKGFSIVNEAEVDVFLEFSCFFNDPMDVGNLISGSSAFSKSSTGSTGGYKSLGARKHMWKERDNREGPKALLKPLTELTVVQLEVGGEGRCWGPPTATSLAG